MMKLQITQVKGLVGSKLNQKETMKTLGLRKIHQTVVREDTPAVRGMIRAVAHLVEVEEVD
ncbi:large subunit ribosomal protein L30 [Arcanobacterium wilhelmae]|uniref:Large ribosomal subunit protein uL30 n=1 Tax=Arcanobacterium wilhelmae TaxID=1803177 RepID=A0ABT9NCH5_9ACTO|nr:50S ribosomal protein L30 [Arcanobacterium wilhelmae]MDP9801403.1 large subunit ribosomal protein L30 [Arcanobacterium wilhelmae]WFN90737.1 50S ribosomal protein L30 [Arcanobacterium wilhelmae]